jgi:uncharacterized protein (TIGR03083 family)
VNGVGVRRDFAAAADGFVAVVAGIGAEAWDRPALGVWSVRDLVGHASRSFSTIETYLAAPTEEIVIHEPADYVLAIRGALLDHDAVAQRGRDAGAALGPDPAAAVSGLAERVTALVDSTPDDAPVGLPWGGATLVVYLATRTFELTVHTLDLAAALGVEPPAVLRQPVAAGLELAAAGAGRGPDAAAVLRALTGRGSLPAGFSVV